MRIVLLALQQNRGGLDSNTQARRIRLEEDQALALARHMRDGGDIAPMLVCCAGSRLQCQAAALKLPLLTVSGPSGGLLGLWRLWRWQRRHKLLLIQTIGEEALNLGHKLLRMRKEGSALLSHAFFLRVPDEARCRSRAMLAAQHILHGSGYVRSRLLAAWEKLSDGGAALEQILMPLAPGINSEGFTAASPFVEGSGQHFVFCMADSLVPRSGMQTVLRAMAALWQRTDLPHWEVRMLGSGPRFQEALDGARDLGVSSRLCLLGEQDAPDILSYCHAWLVPGTAPDEAPETLWQGFAAGLPVICSDSHLHRERLAPHISSNLSDGPVIFVPQGDAQALAKGMIDLMKRAELRSELQVYSRTIVRQTDFQHMASQACALFESWLHDLSSASTDLSQKENRTKQ